MHYVMCVCIPAVCLCTVNLIVSISFHVTLHVFHLLQVKSTFCTPEGQPTHSSDSFGIIVPLYVIAYRASLYRASGIVIVIHVCHMYPHVPCYVYTVQHVWWGAVWQDSKEGTFHWERCLLYLYCIMMCVCVSEAWLIRGFYKYWSWSVQGLWKNPLIAWNVYCMYRFDDGKYEAAWIEHTCHGQTHLVYASPAQCLNSL